MGKVRIGFLVFFLGFFLGLSSCTAQSPSAETDFYEGLKKRQNSAQNEAVACFEKALDNANPVTAAAAAAELMALHSAGTEFSAAKMAAIREKATGKATGSWARAFDALEITEKALAFLLDGDGRSFGEAERYVLNNGTFTETENAAISGRIAVSNSRYTEALIFFRIVLSDSPELFFRYPDLLTDLGRTFQYAATGKEGMELFLEWEKNGDLIPADSENLVRFRLLFFAGRIARQRGDSATAIELFEKAMPFARNVSPEQTDACIWYILDTSFTPNSTRMIQYLEKYASQWHNDAYFSDVLDRFTRELVFKRQWENVLKVYNALKDRPEAAKYAWIISRAIEEKLFSPPANAAESATVYMRTAYEAGRNAARIGNSAWYYRSLSAAALGEPFLVLPAPLIEKPSSEETPEPDQTDTMQFLLGFFENDAAQFAPRFIKTEESNLAPKELYLLAEALNKAGQYQESIQLVSAYTKKNGYHITRQDLELLYPRPFKELVEQYAEETGIEPALLFGLIRMESAFNSDVVSHAGAIGLTQLMPATAQEAAVRIHRQGGPNYVAGPALNLYDPAVNIHIGASYLAFLNTRMEDPLLALLSYNGGMNRVRRWRRGAAANLPPDLFLETVEYSETRNYGRNVMGAAAMYRNLY